MSVKTTPPPLAPAATIGSLLPVIILHIAAYVWMIMLAKLLMTSSDMPFPCFLIFTDQVITVGAILYLRRKLPSPTGSTFNFLGFTRFSIATELFPLGILTLGTSTCGMGSNFFLYPSVTEAISMVGPVFAVPLAIALQNQLALRKRAVVFSLVPLCVGGVLSSAGEVNFHALGMCFAISALAFRALRMIFTSVVVERFDGIVLKRRVILDLALSIMPVNVTSTVALSLYLEGKKPWEKLLLSLAKLRELLLSGVYWSATRTEASFEDVRKEFWSSAMSNPEILIFLLILCKGVCTATWYVTECVLIEKKGGAFIAVLANLSRVCCIGTGLWLFRNPVSSIQMLGFSMTIGGLGLYTKAQAAGAGTSVAEEKSTETRKEK
eukprot:g2862.t1